MYVNDTYQASRKLTVNVGVRWELPFPSVERYDRFTNLLPNAPSPFAQQAGLPGLMGRLALVNSPDNPSRYAAATHLRLFAPRVGLAYRVNDKTVVRSGYGIFYVQNDGTGGSQLTSVSQPWVPTTDNEITPSATLSNPFPTGLIQPPQRNPIYQLDYLGLSISAPIPAPPPSTSGICSSGISTWSGSWPRVWRSRSLMPAPRERISSAAPRSISFPISISRSATQHLQSRCRTRSTA